MEQNVNIQEVVRTAVELEKVRTEVVNAKAQAKLFETLYNDEKIKKADNTKKVELRITQPRKQHDWNLGFERTIFFPVDVITTDLNDAVDRIKSELSVTKDAEITSKKEEIEALQKKIKSLEESRNEFNQDTVKEYTKYKKDLLERYEKKEERLVKELAELSEELDKERTNKTDAELDKKRKEEIAALKVRIKELEKQFNEVVGMNWFQKTWYNLTNMRARIIAEKQVAENKENADSVMNTYTPCWW